MTLALAIIGTVLSLVSLGWQAYTWLRSGPVLKVTTTNTLPLYDQGAGDWHVSVTVTNVGRAATTVTNWGIEMNNGQHMQVMQPLAWSTRLPHRLEPGAEASFHVEADELRRYHAETRVPFKAMRPWVSQGGSRKTFAKGGVPLS